MVDFTQIPDYVAENAATAASNTATVNANINITNNFLLSLGLDVNTYNTSDTSASNVQLLQSVAAKMQIAEIFSKNCLSNMFKCDPSTLQNIASNINSNGLQATKIASLVSYTGNVNDLGALSGAVQNATLKSNAFDSTFVNITGQQQSSNITTDQATYTSKASLLSSIYSAIMSFGNTVFGSSFGVTDLSSKALINSVQDAYTYNVTQSNFAAQSLGLLNWKQAEMPTIATAAHVRNDLSILLNNLQTTFIAKFSPGITASTFTSGTPYTEVLIDAKKKMMQTIAYQKSIGIIKQICTYNPLGGTIANIGGAESINLYNTCTAFASNSGINTALKNVCKALYYYNAAWPYARIVNSAGYFSNGTPDVLKKGCESLNGAWNATGTGAISFSYAPFVYYNSAGIPFSPLGVATINSALSTPDSYALYNQAFGGSYGDFFNEISNSPYAYQVWP